MLDKARKEKSDKYRNSLKKANNEKIKAVLMNMGILTSEENTDNRDLYTIDEAHSRDEYTHTNQFL